MKYDKFIYGVIGMDSRGKGGKVDSLLYITVFVCIKIRYVYAFFKRFLEILKM